MTSPVFTLRRSAAPVLVTIPHAGTELMPGLVERMTERGRLLPDTDWYMEDLYRAASKIGVGVLRARYSRYVIDLNRGSDDALLYAGRPKTGLVPSFTFDGQPIYRAGQEPTLDEIETRKQQFWQPYHDAVADELARLKSIWGWAVLWDAHSIRTEIPRLFEGRLPDLNFGTNDGVSCASSLIETVLGTAQHSTIPPKNTYSTVLNGRFKGGYTTRHYGRPEESIHAIQLEKAQDTYLADENTPWPIDRAKADDLSTLIQRLLECAAAWRPSELSAPQSVVRD